MAGRGGGGVSGSSRTDGKYENDWTFGQEQIFTNDRSWLLTGTSQAIKNTWKYPGLDWRSGMTYREVTLCNTTVLSSYLGPAFQKPINNDPRLNTNPGLNFAVH